MNVFGRKKLFGNLREYFGQMESHFRISFFQAIASMEWLRHGAKLRRSPIDLKPGKNIPVQLPSLFAVKTNEQ